MSIDSPIQHARLFSFGENSHSPSLSVSELALGNQVELDFTVRRLASRSLPNAGTIEFSFQLRAAPARLAALNLPKSLNGVGRARRDELWKSTCFEIFLAAPNQTNYVEANLATNGDWNLYFFTNYREAMRPAAGAEIALLNFTKSAEQIDLSARIEWSNTRATNAASKEAAIFSAATIELAASVVLDWGADGVEYWALKHVAERPDFHRRESFLLKI